MERFKRRFSFDAPTPYATPRRQSEPVVMGSSELSVGQPRLNRRYSTAAHTPESKLQALPESLEIAKQQKYSTNQEVCSVKQSFLWICDKQYYMTRTSKCLILGLLDG